MAHHYHEDSDPTLVGPCRLSWCKESVWSTEAAHFGHIKDLISEEMIEELVAVATEAYQGAFLDGLDRRPDLRKGFMKSLRKRLGEK
jgi:hypothetical protein